MKLKFFLTSLIITSILTLTNCNTVRGFGEDIESGGEAMQRASSRHE